MTHAAPRTLPAPPSDVIPAGHVTMWAVAWRLHRAAIFTLVGMMTVSAGMMVWLRYRVLGLYERFGCELFPIDPYAAECLDPDGTSVWWSYGLTDRFAFMSLNDLSSIAHMGMIGGPVILGVFAAAPIFTREFGRGTQVFALTQSVSRSRWFTAKIVVLLAPLLAGLTALGFLMEWVDRAVGVSDHGGMNQDIFLQRGIMPAAVGLATFALTIAIGMVARATTATLVAGLICGFALVAGSAFIQPHVAHLERVTVPIETLYAPLTQAQLDAAHAGTAPWPGTTPIEFDKDDAWVDSGYLDLDGREIAQGPGSTSRCYDKLGKATEKAAAEATSGPNAISMDEFYSSPRAMNANSAALLDCLRDLGATERYTDILRVDQLWPLRLTLGGILSALAALFFAAGWYRLPRAVSKRS